ncbi:low temperature requirement protein A [Kitasatospora sp. McL0602]|uniref:low temperature requirement protein A n=1 Tax=Kitasatospora sp. McL0602 TaxID=3439530 RepID=UPI003F89AE0D
MSGERHASWTELFFDLVVVAGVLQISHLLHAGPTAADLGLYVLVYLAFWTTWVCFTVYGNIEGRQEWAPSLVVAMLGLAVMVAAVPGIRTEHARGFAIAYVLLRWLGGQVWPRGRVVVDWPVAQVGGGTVPWLVSIWVDAPGRYWLWAGGLAFDLLVMLTASGYRVLRAAQERVTRGVARRGRSDRTPVVVAARTDVPHLAERLGLFVIIVLGEGVIQITSAAAEVPWDHALTAAATGAFVLLIGLWTMSLLHGFGGIPKLGPGDLPVRAALGLHGVLTCAIALLAAGLGLAIEHPHGAVEGGTRWLLCGGLSGYFAVSALVALLTRAGWPATLRWAAPCLLLPLGLGAFADGIGPGGLVWALVAATLWQLVNAPGMVAALRPRGGRPAR